MQADVCMHTRIPTCTLTHIHTCIYTPTCTIIHAHTCQCTLVHALRYIHTHQRAHMLSHVHAPSAHSRSHLCIHTRAAVGRAAQYFRSPFTEAVDSVLTSPCWFSGLWRRFLMNL